MLFILRLLPPLYKITSWIYNIPAFLFLPLLFLHWMVISTTFQSAVTTETSTRCIDSPLSLVISPYLLHWKHCHYRFIQLLQVIHPFVCILRRVLGLQVACSSSERRWAVESSRVLQACYGHFFELLCEWIVASGESSSILLTHYVLQALLEIVLGRIFVQQSLIYKSYSSPVCLMVCIYTNHPALVVFLIFLNSISSFLGSQHDDDPS